MDEYLELKLARSKRGKIFVFLYKEYSDALRFLNYMRTKGYNGIISKNGKPIKEGAT